MTAQTMTLSIDMITLKQSEKQLDDLYEEILSNASPLPARPKHQALNSFTCLPILPTLMEWRQDTLVRFIDILREAVRKTRRERPFPIDAWVVLPDHMHCVWTLPPGDDDFSNRWKSIKIRFVQTIPRTDYRSTGLARSKIKTEFRVTY